MNKFRCKRIEANLTLKKLGEILGLNYKTIYQYEKGLREPKLKILRKMAQYFNCTIDELVD